MKLWMRVALASTSLILLVLISAGALLFYAEKLHLLESQARQQEESVQRLAQVCIESAAEQNDLILLNYVLALSNSPGVHAASMIGPDGRIVVNSDVARVGQTLPADELSQLVSASAAARKEISGPGGKRLLELSLPVLHQNRRIGTARMEYDQEYFQRQVESTLRATVARFIYVGGVAIAVGLLGSIVFARGMTKPISKLSEATRVIGQGELTHRISIPRSDEIGQLAKSFNDMAQKLQELDELKSDFVSSVSHELRSPLTALKGFLQMFQAGITGPLNDQQKDNVKLMLECTDRLGGFVNDILDVAKLEAGMFDFNIAPCDPKAIAAQTVALYTPQANSEGLKLVDALPAQCPKILADGDRLKQVFANLVSNAMKFTPKDGQVMLWMKEQNGRVLLGVTDTGAGIPKEAIPKLFNKFQQVKETKSQAKRKGTGLGLLICKKIVEGCGGTIGVESELGKGTTFYFALPKAV